MIPLLDTHQHLIYREKVGYGWTTGIPALAAGDFTLSDYAGLTRDAGIGGTLFMETGVDDADYQAETRFVHGLSKDPGSGVVGIIASIRPESEDGFDAWLTPSVPGEAPAGLESTGEALFNRMWTALHEVAA